MSKTTEGVIFTSGEQGSSNALPQHIEQQLNKLSALPNSLPNIARLQFVLDVRKAIGHVHDQNLPISIKPTLQNLLSQCDHYLELGNESSFVQQCEHAIKLCGQGWNYLSYWVSTEQSLCYSIFWGLKAAVENHKKYMAMYTGSKNDGSPQNDPNLPKKQKNNIAQLLQKHKMRYLTAAGSIAPSKFKQLLNRQRTKVIVLNLPTHHLSDNVCSLDRYLYVKQRVMSDKQK